MPLRPRQEIETMAAAAHGGPNEAEARETGLSADEIADFSVCANPYMGPPDMDEVLKQVAVDRLPDSECTAFREALADRLNIPAGNIIAGNGALEPIRLIAQAYFGPGDDILLPEPTFGEYEIACRIAGAGIIVQNANENNNFRHDTDETRSLIQQHKPKGVFICNPNNPTGQYLSHGEITAIAEASEETLLVIDEAYINFVEGSWCSLDMIERENVIIVRSMTKDFALAGLRLGYAVASEGIIDILRRVRPPWTVNAVAQEAGIAALRDYGKLGETRRKILAAKDYLVAELTGLGYQITPTATHFFLMKVQDAPGFRSALLKRGFLVRDCASFGLPGYIRIAARTMPECKRLITTIKELQ